MATRSANKIKVADYQNTDWSGLFTHNESIDLTLTAIPEPGTWFGAALTMSILLCTQRRRFVSKKTERKVTKETKLRSLFLPLLLRSLRCLL